MAITTEEIKALRDETGISVMECKKALEEANGDRTVALKILQERGNVFAGKKAGRTLGSGAIQAYVHNTRTVAALVLLSRETDFVAKNEEFVKLAYELAMHVAASNPSYLSRTDAPEGTTEGILLEESFIKDPGRTIQDLLSSAVQKFGERIEIGKFTRFSTST